jgi:hypothetical protein
VIDKDILVMLAKTETVTVRIEYKEEYVKTIYTF